MPRFRPTPPGVHDSPEWKAASALARTIHRTIRPVSGELEVPPARPGDAPAVTFQAKAAELGAYLFPEECAQVVRDALAAKLWQVRGDVLVIPAFPPSFEAKRKAEGRGAQGGESGAKRTAQWRERRKLRELLESLEGDGDGAVERVAARLAKGDAGKAAKLTAALRSALADDAAEAPTGEASAAAENVTVTAPVTGSVTGSVTVTGGETTPPPAAPGDPFRGSRGAGEDGDGERHAVTPVPPVAPPPAPPMRTLTPLELGRQLRDALVAAGRAFVGAAADEELEGLGALASAQGYAVGDAARIARHWSAEPKAPRAIFAWDKSAHRGAPVSVGLLLGRRDAATGRYAGRGFREAHRAALAWEGEAADKPGVARATEASPVELARAEWRRDCEAREAKGYVTVGFEAWLSQGDDLHRAEARSWKARAARSKPKGATG